LGRPITIDQRQRQLGFVMAVRLQLVGFDTQLRRDFSNRTWRDRSRNFNIGSNELCGGREIHVGHPARVLRFGIRTTKVSVANVSDNHPTERRQTFCNGTNKDIGFFARDTK
jgi:hypothetical protein